MQRAGISLPVFPAAHACCGSAVCDGVTLSLRDCVNFVNRRAQ